MRWVFLFCILFHNHRMSPSSSSKLTTLAFAYFGLWALCHMLLNAGLYLPLPTTWAFDGSRLIESLLVLSLAICAPAMLGAPHRRWLIALALLGAMVTTSALMSEMPQVAILWLGFYLTWILAILVLAQLLQPNLHEFTKYFALVSTAAVAIFGVRFLADFVIALYTGHWHSWELWWVRYENIRTFSQLLVWTLPLVPAVLWSLRNAPQRWRIAAVAAWVMWGSMFYWSGSRSVLVGLVSAILAGLLFAGPHVRPYLRQLVVYMLLAFALFGGMKLISLRSMPPQESSYDFTRTSSPGRLMLWEDALHVAADHPWLGVGPYHFSWHSRREAAGPHSWLFESLAEYGIPLTLLFIALLLRAFWRMRQQVVLRAPETDPWPCALLLTLAAVVMDGLFEGVQIPPYSRVLGLMVLALAVAWFCGPLDAGAQTASPTARRAWRGLLGLVVGGTLCLYALEVYHRWPCLTESMDEALKRPAEIQQRRPRFWMAGRSPFIPSCHPAPVEVKP
jgi:putative inorganic carbon (hco3(-)) transporter